MGLSIRRIVPEDMGEINSWIASRDRHIFDTDFLPPTGWVIPGVMAAWGYKTDSKLVILENVISNKESSKEDRFHGLDLIGSACEAWAKENGFKFIIGWTSMDTVGDACKRNGWIVSEPNYRSMVKFYV